MREIKYRIWITPWGSDAEPYMQYIPDLHLHVFFGNWERGGYKDAVFQQFTGLKDKNGKEIYEGDIIETMYDVSCFKLKNGEILEGAEPGHFMIEKPVLSKVKWSGVGFDLGGKIQIGWRKKDAFKVVGNLFETPELLKQ